MHDNYNNVEIKQLTDPVVSAVAIDSASVDLANYQTASFFVSYGENGQALSGSNYFSCHLEESDDDSTFTDVGASDVIGSTANLFGVNNYSTDDDAVYGLGYRGNKRYVRVAMTETGTISTGTPVGIYAVLEPVEKPASNVVKGS